jgi:hypothetical protein
MQKKAWRSLARDYSGISTTVKTRYLPVQWLPIVLQLDSRAIVVVMGLVTRSG